MAGCWCWVIGVEDEDEERVLEWKLHHKLIYPARWPSRSEFLVGREYHKQTDTN